jgi:hypothetical protein
MTPWAWVGRALASALILVCAGAAVGAIGAFTLPSIGMVLGAIFVCLGGAAWSVPRIGGAGLGAAFVGLTAAIGVTLEGHHAVVAQTAVVVEVPSLSAWDPRSDVVAVRVPSLVHLVEHEASVSYRVRSGKNTTTNHEIVVPLLDPSEQRVVGFHCRSRQDPRRRDGGWALASPAWNGEPDMDCARGVEAAVNGLAAAGVAVAPGAEARLVEVFASEHELRNAADLEMMWRIPTGFFAIYAVLVAVYRKRGASSV